VNPSLGGGTIARLLWVGALNGGALGWSEGAATHLVDFGLIGAAVDATDFRGHHPLAGIDTDRFYVRDVSDPRSTSSQLCGTPEQPVEHLRRGIFWNVQTGSVPCVVDGAAQLSDVAFVDVAKARDPGPLLEVLGTADGAGLARLTMAFRAPLLGLTHGIEIRDGARAAVDGPLLTGFTAPPATTAMHVGAEEAGLLTWGAPTCFFDDAADDDETVIAAYGTTPLRGIDPLFESPSEGRYDFLATSPALAAGCGARVAGVRIDNWAHRKAKLRPLFLTLRPTPCGISAELVFVLAPLLRAFSRGSRAASRRARGSRADGPSA